MHRPMSIVLRFGRRRLRAVGRPVLHARLLMPCASEALGKREVLA